MEQESTKILPAPHGTKHQELAYEASNSGNQGSSMAGSLRTCMVLRLPPQCSYSRECVPQQPQPLQSVTRFLQVHNPCQRRTELPVKGKTEVQNRSDRAE